MPVTEIFPVSFDAAVDVLERLGDMSSEVVPIEVVAFTNAASEVYYRLGWDKAYHLIESIWTIPPGKDARSWIAENAPDSEYGEWVNVWFPSEKRRDLFFAALVKASTHGRPPFFRSASWSVLSELSARKADDDFPKHRS